MGGHRRAPQQTATSGQREDVAGDVETPAGAVAGAPEGTTRPTACGPPGGKEGLRGDARPTRQKRDRHRSARSVDPPEGERGQSEEGEVSITKRVPRGLRSGGSLPPARGPSPGERECCLRAG